jgi:hypothetical protein
MARRGIPALNITVRPGRRANHMHSAVRSQFGKANRARLAP